MDAKSGNREFLSHSQRMNRDLDETSLMLEKLAQSLFPVDEVVAVADSSDAAEVVHREWRKSRHSTVSASISEPDLSQV